MVTYEDHVNKEVTEYHTLGEAINHLELKGINIQKMKGMKGVSPF
ncbi:hypothetical protein [Xenorhabdus sp. PB62.4]|nr:hypothetical protein [Xenorhabdus sp. PB62.4]